jgi:hypothetical protein
MAGMIADPRVQKEEALAKAMKKSPPPIGPELEKLLTNWLAITSVNQPGQPNALRFPFLKWAVQGRAKDVIAHLKKSKAPEAKDIVAEIVRIANLPFPPKNESAQAEAMDIWAWLKVELYGKV